MSKFEPSINEKEFILDALRKGIRLDGRTPFDLRSLKINFIGNGQVEIQLGRTRVITYVTAEPVHPYPDRPTEGFLIFNTEYSPMCSPTIESGRVSEEEILVSRMLEKSLKQSRAIDTESLCILSGELVWNIRVDVTVLDHDGNILDAVSIACISALKQFRRPEVTVVGQEVTIHPITQRNPVPLNILHTPICLTFAYFDEGERFVIDPTYLEEQLGASQLTVTLNNHGELCVVSKSGGTPLALPLVVRCSQIAAMKVKEILECIESSVESQQVS